MNIILFDQLKDENIISFGDERASHIRKVLRLGTGDTFKAGVINGQKGIARITAMDNQRISFSFVGEGMGKPLHPVVLLVAQVRPISMRRILREAVSLGVGKIILTTTDTAEKSYAQAKLYESGEYRSILIDGAMQSGETAIAEVLFASSVQEAITLAGGPLLRIVLDNKREAEPLSMMHIERDASVLLAIGGERGFSDREREVFDTRGFQYASLGTRILRTETAVSAGVALLLGRMGLL